MLGDSVKKKKNKTGNGYISKEELEELLEEVSNKLVDGITRLELEERTISPRII
jgi:hypothetical protein